MDIMEWKRMKRYEKVRNGMKCKCNSYISKCSWWYRYENRAYQTISI